MVLQEFRQTLAALQGVLGELAARPAAAGASVFSPPAASTVSATVRPTPQRSCALCSTPGDTCWSNLMQQLAGGCSADAQLTFSDFRGLQSRPLIAAGRIGIRGTTQWLAGTLQVQSWLSSLCRGVGAAAWGAVSQADTAALALARRVLLPLPAANAQVLARPVIAFAAGKGDKQLDS